MIYSSQEFRANLKEAFELADRGEVVTIERRIRNVPGQPTKVYTLQAAEKVDNHKNNGLQTEESRRPS